MASHVAASSVALMMLPLCVVVVRRSRVRVRSLWEVEEHQNEGGVCTSPSVRPGYALCTTMPNRWRSSLSSRSYADYYAVCARATRAKTAVPAVLPLLRCLCIRRPRHNLTAADVDRPCPQYISLPNTVCGVLPRASRRRMWKCVPEGRGPQVARPVEQRIDS